MSATTAELKRAESYWQIAWRQLKRKRLAMASLWFVVGLFFLATYACWIAMDVPLFLRTTDEISSPILDALFDRNIFPSGIDIFFNLLSFFLLPLTLVTWFAQRHWKAVWGTGLTLFVAALILILGPQRYSLPYTDFMGAHWDSPDAVFPPLAFSLRPTDTANNKREPGTRDVIHGRIFLLGSDDKNRDVLSLLIYGTRISMTIGIVAVSIYVAIGTILGSLAGYCGGWVDHVISRFIEIMISIPTLILIIAIVGILEDRNIFNVMIVIGITGWTGVARLVRAEFLRLRELDFVMGARSLGASTKRIIFRHVLPNALGPILVTAALGVPSAIIAESGLSFLGLGDVNSPSWGQILESGRKSGLLGWLIHPPGLAIFLTVSAMNLLGDGVRDALDPKLRGR